MKLIVFLLFLISCNEKPGLDRNGKENYLTNGYICDTLDQRTWGTQVYNCENVINGNKVETIINPSNVFIIPEVK
jgi:hypothetical protein